jgi:hypothetical protein
MSQHPELRLGRIYRTNIDGDYVRTVEEYTPEHPEYHLGFRFRGDNKCSYDAHGFDMALFSGEVIAQHHSQPLVAEITRKSPAFDLLPLDLKVGDFFCNDMGGVVVIFEDVKESDRLYKRGYRFIDHKGTYYKPDGTVVAWGPRAILNLVIRVPAEKVTAKEMNLIHQQVDRNIEIMDNHDEIKAKISRLKKKAKRYFKPVSISIGIGAVLGSAIVAQR